MLSDSVDLKLMTPNYACSPKIHHLISIVPFLSDYIIVHIVAVAHSNNKYSNAGSSLQNAAR